MPTLSPLWFDLIVLFYMDSLNKTRSLFDIKVYEAKKALIKDIGPVNRVHLTVLISVDCSCWFKFLVLAWVESARGLASTLHLFVRFAFCLELALYHYPAIPHGVVPDSPFTQVCNEYTSHEIIWFAFNQNRFPSIFFIFSVIRSVWSLC